MAPYQERVVAEKAELDAKLAKLRAFLFTDLFETLDSDTQGLLWKQAGHMYNYSKVLGERIAAFSTD